MPLFNSPIDFLHIRQPLIVHQICQPMHHPVVKHFEATKLIFGCYFANSYSLQKIHKWSTVTIEDVWVPRNILDLSKMKYLLSMNDRDSYCWTPSTELLRLTLWPVTLSWTWHFLFKFHSSFWWPLNAVLSREKFSFHC